MTTQPSDRPLQPARPVVPLPEAVGLDAAQIGGKAATLARVAAAGLPVPAGFVIPAAAFAQPDQLTAALSAAAENLGAERLAVRSSAVSEDLPEASYAGLYATRLGVDLTGLAEAVAHVHTSAATPRVAAYRQHHPEATRSGPIAAGGQAGMAVLVQRMLDPAASGVAFTANPLTGAREETVITAVTGLGERLVAGQAIGDAWVVHGDQACCTRQTEHAITPSQAREVAALARRVQELLGVPQDIEWAIQDDKVWLLQARPMTALPDPVAWTPPGPGLWLRNLRLGEWLPDPMTPLFADWLLPRLEAGFARGMRATAGAVLPFPSAVVNGWYYTRANPSPRAIVRAILATRGRILPFMWWALVVPFRDPAAADRCLLGGLAGRWQTELLPRSQHLAASGWCELPAAEPARLLHLVEETAELAGECFWSLAVVGGAAWKMEAALARFHRRHLAHRHQQPDAGEVQRLLAGLPGTQPDLPPHAVHSLDPVHPTAGEQGWQPDQAGGQDRHARLAAGREATTCACLTALAGDRRARDRFTALLQVAQRYAVLREQQARSLTLGWPLLRDCLLRLGQGLAEAGVIDRPEDVCFLTRAELDHTTPLRGTVGARRATWTGQRRLAAPLTLGTPPRLLARLLHTTQPPADDTAASGALVGAPASPGQATGTVRVVTDPDDFATFQPGEILVARATAPAWTPLFARAAAVVTDAGTVAAHASLVAREYAIPAVVGTGVATRRLRTGQVVTVDGTTGHIHPRT